MEKKPSSLKNIDRNVDEDEDFYTQMAGDDGIITADEVPIVRLVKNIPIRIHFPPLGLISFLNAPYKLCCRQILKTLT